MRPKPNPQSGSWWLAGGGFTAAFTRTDLMMVLCVMSLLAAVQLAALGRTHVRSEQMVCMENLRRLAAGWLMYADDSAGKLVPNPDGGNSGKAPADAAWVGGWLDFTQSLDNIETRFLVDPNYLYGGKLGPYVKRDHLLFRCPGDTSTVRLYGRMFSRVRSVSLNNWLNGRAWTGCKYGDYWMIFRKLSDFRRVATSGIWLMTDEHPMGINDGSLMNDMCNQKGVYTIVDYPAAYHNQGANLSFTDGHVEYWQWRDPRTTPVVQPWDLLPLNVPSPGNQDIARLQAASTVRQ